jgi:hypothetical protein
MSQVSFKYFENYFLSLNADLSTPILPGWNWHLAQSDKIGMAGCQGFIGPYPSAFLDKHLFKIS